MKKYKCKDGRVAYELPKCTICGKQSNTTDKETAQILVQLPNGEKRIWTINSTSQRMLAGQLGSNSDNWTGKTATLYTLEQNVKGTMRQCIYVKSTHNDKKMM